MGTPFHEPSSRSDEREPLLPMPEQQTGQNGEEEDDLSSIASIYSTTAHIRQLLVRILELNPIANAVRTYEPLPDDVSDADSGLSVSFGDRRQILVSSDVPSSVRIAQVVVGLLSCLLTSGVIFGYAALKPVLIDQDVYAQNCTQLEIDRGMSPCYYQNLRLDLLFATGAAVTCICPVPVGFFIVAFGPKLCGIFGNLLLALGALVISVAKHLPIDGYFLGFFLLALGGPLVYLSSFHLSNAFPKHSDAILTSIACSYELSSALFLGLNILQKTGFASLTSFFLVYAIVNFGLLATQIFLMPSGSYELERENGPHNEDREDITDQRWHEEESGPERRVRLLKSSDLWGAMHHASALQQIFSPWFFLITLLAVIQTLRNNHLIASMSAQYWYLFGDSAEQKRLTYSFHALLPIGGAISVPISNALLDRVSVSKVMMTLTFVPMVFGVLGCLRNSAASAYLSIALFTLYRPFLNLAVSDYAARVFGFATFPKVTGLISLFSGLGNLFQLLLDVLTDASFKGNPIPVNIILTSASSLFGFMIMAFVWWESRQLRKRNACGCTARAA